MPEESPLLNTQDAADHVASLQAELARLRDELEHSQRLATIGVIAAGIAHEINNILTPVLAYAQLAISNPNDVKLHAKALDRTVQGVQTVTQVAEAMLGFSATPVQPDAANISDTANAALDCLGRDPAKDRIQISLKFQPQMAVQIKPLALQQVLMNLLLNALEAMKPTGGSLTIHASERADGSTVIEVTDTGPGIPFEIVGRLFKPFAHSSHIAGRITSKASQSKTKHSARDTESGRRGTGLGLAICRRLIEGAGGTITANSSPGRGTTFTIVLHTARTARAKAG